jgi:hypothetical protein
MTMRNRRKFQILTAYVLTFKYRLTSPTRRSNALWAGILEPHEMAR